MITMSLLFILLCITQCNRCYAFSSSRILESILAVHEEHDTLCALRRMPSAAEFEMDETAYAADADGPCRAYYGDGGGGGGVMPQCGGRVCDSAFGCLRRTLTPSRDMIREWSQRRKGAGQIKTCRMCASHRHPLHPMVELDSILMMEVTPPLEASRVAAAFGTFRHYMETIEIDQRIAMPRFAVVLYDGDDTLLVQDYTMSLDTVSSTLERVHEVLKAPEWNMKLNASDAAASAALPQATFKAISRMLTNSSMELTCGWREMSTSADGEAHTFLERPCLLRHRRPVSQDIAPHKHIVVVTGTQRDDTIAAQQAFTDEVLEEQYVAMDNAIADIEQQHASLSMFVDHSGRNKDVFGNPEYSVFYEGYVKFMSAITLQRLIRVRSRQASCFQAHLLSKGIEAALFRTTAMADMDATSNLFDPTYAIRLPRPCSECAMGECSGNECAIMREGCRYGEQCKPLSGCRQSRVHHDPMSGHNSRPDDDRTQPPFLHSQRYTGDADSWTEEFLDIANVPVLQWKPDEPFVELLIEQAKPVILRRSVVSTWPAANWTMEEWGEKLSTNGVSELLNVKRSIRTVQNRKVSNRKTAPPKYDADWRTLMGAAAKENNSFPLLDRFNSYVEHNMSTSEAIREMLTNEDRTLYYFGDMPQALRKDAPSDMLFLTEEDVKLYRQFVWLSSPGVRMHSHFDQDYNFFVQLVGEKQFLLVPPEYHEHMYMFPRIHPLWHKSQVDPINTPIEDFPMYTHIRPMIANVQPGDILYVPQYWWHQVRTLTPSVSLSTWSHDMTVYDHMGTLYNYDHKFDTITNSTGKMYAVRTYIDLLVQRLVGTGSTRNYILNLLRTRYSRVGALFEWDYDDPSICEKHVHPDETGKIPTAVHVFGDAQFDVGLMDEHFDVLNDKPAIRDILLANYIEEISAQTVGVERVLSFFQYCFQDQPYYITDASNDDHNLWL
jgi:Cupin-like domain